MRPFLQRISSRKFLAAVAVQVAATAALFWPGQASVIGEAAVRIAALLTLLLAGLGYGRIEAAIDAQADQERSAASQPH